MKNYLLLIVLLSFFLACSKKHEEKPIPVTPINPVTPVNPDNGFDPDHPSFRVGTKWKYLYSFYNSGGSVYSIDSITLEISRDTMINGSKYYITTSNYYFSNQTTGYFEFDKNLSRENLIYKNPASATDLYTSYALSTPPSNCILKFDAQVKNIDTTEMANGKTYEKLLYYYFNYYSQNCQTIPTYTYELYSSKMGLRLLQLFYSNGVLSQKIELTSFTY